MPDNDQENTPATIWEFLGEIADGGLLRLMASKPMQEAIGRLVHGLADVPSAYLERVSQRIRTDTVAGKRVMESLSKSAATKAAKDKGLVARGVDRWTRQLKTRQATREDIAARTLEILSEDGLDGAVAPPEDFMRFFEEIAERASSEEMADLMARIFAGEIRKPGAISRRTLQISMVLDHDIIGAIHFARSRLILPGWIHVNARNQDLQTALDLLDSVSLTRYASNRSLVFNENAELVIQTHSGGIILTPADFPTFLVNLATLTPTGNELMSILPLPIENKDEEIARGFHALNIIEKAELCDFLPQDQGGGIINRRELPAS
jgi:Protein of unknown function (DUF2806)